MAASPMSDPSQSAPQGGTTQQGAPQPPAAGGGDPSSATGAQAPPNMVALMNIKNVLDHLAQAEPAASAGLAKATAGIQEAMSAIVSQPPTSGPSQSPPY